MYLLGRQRYCPGEGKQTTPLTTVALDPDAEWGPTGYDTRPRPIATTLPGFATMLTVLAINLIGDGLRK